MPAFSPKSLALLGHATRPEETPYTMQPLLGSANSLRLDKTRRYPSVRPDGQMAGVGSPEGSMSGVAEGTRKEASPSIRPSAFAKSSNIPDPEPVILPMEKPEESLFEKSYTPAMLMGYHAIPG